MGNASLTTGVFPEIWKYAMVLPLITRADQENVKN